MPGIREFRDKVVVVTGAGSGIGRATAVAFAAEGADVVLADIKGDRARDAAKAIEDQGGKALGCEIDVAEAAQVEALAKQVVADRGRVDIVFNNAGVGLGGRAFDAGPEDWEWIVGINFWGVVYGMKYFSPYMIENRSGHIVNTASMAGLVVAPGLAAYSATKHAVVGLSQATRLEMREHNIGVTVICPGLISTAIAADGRFYMREEDGQSLEQAVEMMEKRGWPPERVAGAVLKAVRRDKAIVPVGPEAWIGWYIQRLSPRLAAVFMNYLVNRGS